MKATRTAIAAIVAALLAMSAAAAPRQAAGFAKPPAAALKALKATVGKPFTSGYVFVDGKYMKPPYKVERWGTVIRVNGVQVTNEIVPWEEFIKTQEGVQVTKTTTPVAAQPVAAEPETQEEEEDVDDGEVSFDDLFDDEPAAKKKPAKKKKKAPRPRPRKPTVTVTYSFDGEFVPNDKTKAYLERINAARTRIDRQLRAGGYYFFGSRYSAISGDAGAGGHLFEKLPDMMKRYSDRDAFASALFSAGFNYLPQPLVHDLFRNRIDYVQIEQRLKSAQEERKWSSVLGGGL